MKKTDYAMIILIAGMSLLISYFVVSALPMFKDVGKPVSVKTADPIDPTVQPIDKKVFNKDAINPTVEIYIGKPNPIFSDDTQDQSQTESDSQNQSDTSDETPTNESQ